MQETGKVGASLGSGKTVVLYKGHSTTNCFEAEEEVLPGAETLCDKRR